MIHVIATITVAPAAKKKLIALFKKNIPKVQAEDGCIAYGLTVDVDSGIPIQTGPRDDVVTVVETWESLEHLRAHLATPNMAEYHRATEGMVAGVTLQVLEPV